MFPCTSQPPPPLYECVDVCKDAPAGVEEGDGVES